MKLFQKARDGGPESTVWGYFLFEFKSLFSIVLLKFEGKSRDAYHSHAFNAVSWVLSGHLTERVLAGHGLSAVNPYPACSTPVLTFRETFHKVDAENPTWVLSFRGPWDKTWREYSRETGDITLAQGRTRVQAKP